MNRRSLLKSLSASFLALVSRPFVRKGEAGPPGPGKQGSQPHSDVIPYFLDSGNLSADEKEQLEQIFAHEEAVLAGRPVGKMRGKPPRRAPTFRLVKWEGELGNPEGRFIGPLSVMPMIGPQTAYGYGVNAQILALRAASQDWGKTCSRGTLTIEFRTLQGGEPVTWLYAQQFELDQSGRANIGLEYVAQRNNAPAPIVTDIPIVDIRIQLMRNIGESAKWLRKVLQICSYIVGIPMGAAPGAAEALVAQVLPAIHVPQLLQEGVALSQAVFGSEQKEDPLWRSGWTSYAIAKGGGRLRIAPGLWVVIDDNRAAELTGARLEEVNGQVTLTREGKPIDANYLVLSFEVVEAQQPAPYYAQPQPQQTPQPGGSTQP
jgi:hypothetical protein